ncbi:hypothetical protein ACFQY4_25615 [Catellatospora bangladeshensis]|uniref:hypothetical protein n=1 Tax=Catellatospora bangladeshensis TaxID=310355 RepID=UPI0036120BF2
MPRDHRRLGGQGGERGFAVEGDPPSAASARATKIDPVGWASWLRGAIRTAVPKAQLPLRRVIVTRASSPVAAPLPWSRSGRVVSR